MIYVFIYYSCIVQFDEEFFLRKIKYVIFLAHFILVFIYMYLTNNLELMTTVIFKICLFFLLFKAIFIHVTSINKKYYTFVILRVEFLCSLIFFIYFRVFAPYICFICIMSYEHTTVVRKLLRQPRQPIYFPF